MMVCEEEVVNWFQGLKGHQRIPILRQLVHMCHPLELRFIASCVEDACRTDCLTMRSAELNANTQNVLKSLASPLDVEARSKIIVYLCLLNSTNKLCSRILSQKICDHESVAQFCDDVHKQLVDGELPSSEERRALDELRLLYLLASLHPSFDFIERQHYRAMCSSLNDIESELKKLERKEEQKQVESVVPKPCCDGGSHRDHAPKPCTSRPCAAKSCSLCFSTSAYEHICKLRLLPRGGRHPGEGDHENQVNVQWSTGKFSNLVIRDSQLRQLHARLEAPQPESIILQPRLPPFPHDPTDPGQVNSYLQHLQGLSAVTWPRSESVYQFFRQLADEQEQRGRGTARPHSVYTPRPAEMSGPPGRQPVTNGLPPPGPGDSAPHRLTMPLQNGCSPEADSSSETSPAVLDEDAEVKSCTIYNSNITNGRAGSRSPLPVTLLSPGQPSSPERPAASCWSPRPSAHSPSQGLPRPSAPSPSQGQPRPAAPSPVLTNGVARPRPPADSTSRGGPGHRRRGQTDSRGGSVDKEETPRTPAVVNAASSATVTVTVTAATVTASAATGTAGTTGSTRDKHAGKAVVSPRAVVGSAGPPPAHSTTVPAPAPVPPPGPTTLHARIICSQTAGLLPSPGLPLPAGACGHTHTPPTYSSVTAQSVANGTPAPLVDGVRCGAASDSPLVFAGHSTGSPPPAPGYRPAQRGVSDLLSTGSSPSPPAPAGSPAAGLAPPPPPAPVPAPHTLSSFLPAFSSRPPPPLAQPPLSLVYPGGGFVQHAFPPTHEMPAFYAATYAPHTLQFAAVAPPRAAPQPPPPPPPARPLSCYNCGKGHRGRLCPLENAMNDASQQNQFKMTFVPSIPEN